MISGQIVEAQQIDPSSWVDHAVQLLGAGGVALLLREIVKQIFARANKQDDNAGVLRADLRQQVSDLVLRVDTLTRRLDEAQARENRLFEENAELKAENRGLRDRYHRLINWIAQQPGLPTPPPWLYESTPGPTVRESRES
jgi:ABC-type phosphate transport system auxiliary subunit